MTAMPDRLRGGARKLISALAGLAYFSLSAVVERGFFEYLPEGARSWLEARIVAGRQLRSGDDGEQ